MIQVKYYITHPTWFTSKLRPDWEFALAKAIGNQHMMAGDGGGSGSGLGWTQERVKKACVKANSLLVSFCVISSSVGHCSTHCIYSKAQCHTPLWKRALRTISPPPPLPARSAPSTLHPSSPLLPVPELASFVGPFFEFSSLRDGCWCKNFVLNVISAVEYYWY